MTTTAHVTPSRRPLVNCLAVPACGALLTAIAVWLGTAHADILREVTHTQGTNDSADFDLFRLVDGLMTPALWIVVGLAPLAMAWGAGAMLFGGRHGPQIMGGAVVAVVLVASATGIAK